MAGGIWWRWDLVWHWISGPPSRGRSRHGNPYRRRLHGSQGRRDGGGTARFSQDAAAPAWHTGRLRPGRCHGLRTVSVPAPQACLAGRPDAGQVRRAWASGPMRRSWLPVWPRAIAGAISEAAIQCTSAAPASAAATAVQARPHTVTVTVSCSTPVAAASTATVPGARALQGTRRQRASSRRSRPAVPEHPQDGRPGDLTGDDPDPTRPRRSADGAGPLACYGCRGPAVCHAGQG